MGRQWAAMAFPVLLSTLLISTSIPISAASSSLDFLCTGGAAGENAGTVSSFLRSSSMTPVLQLGDWASGEALGFVIHCPMEAIPVDFTPSQASIVLTVSHTEGVDPTSSVHWTDSAAASITIQKSSPDGYFGSSTLLEPSDFEPLSTLPNVASEWTAEGSVVQATLTSAAVTDIASHPDWVQYRLKVAEGSNGNDADDFVAFHRVTEGMRPVLRLEGILDLCPDDASKTEAGECGCGVTEDTGDSDGDGTINCLDNCPSDSSKTEPGSCGCGMTEDALDDDADGTINCLDGCPSDAEKTVAGVCGCGVSEDAEDDDEDGTANCLDGCPADASKTESGECGCGVTEDTGDSDGDGVINCLDECPGDPEKSVAGLSGCDGTILRIQCLGGEAQAQDGFLKEGLFSCSTKDGADALRLGRDTGFIVSCPVPTSMLDTDGIASAQLVLTDGSSDTLSTASLTDRPLHISLAESFSSSAMLEPQDYSASALRDSLHVSTTASVDGKTSLSLDSASLVTVDRTLSQWQFRVKPTADAGFSESGYIGFFNGASAATAPVLVLEIEAGGADECPDDPAKIVPGACGCGVAEDTGDSDEDGTINCLDGCPSDAEKTEAGVCGCGVSEDDDDEDGTANCLDGCPADASKTEAGECGCGVTEDTGDSDGDGVINCLDECPDDPALTVAGECGCSECETSLPRVVVFTDICNPDYNSAANFAEDAKDRDDVQSLVRFLAHSNMFRVEALVAQTSWSGPASSVPNGVTTGVIFPETIRKVLDDYDLAYNNLASHASGFPSPSYLRSRTFTGRVHTQNSNYWRADYVRYDIGDGRGSEASDVVKDLLRTATEPIWFMAWGKTIELGQALYELNVEFAGDAARMAEIVSMVRVYDIAGQDNVGAYIMHNFPDVPIYLRSLEQYQSIYRYGDQSLFDESWRKTHVLGHSALGNAYPSLDFSHTVAEGDSPSFLYLMSPALGLSEVDQWSWGSWGGRFNPDASLNPRRSRTSSTSGLTPYYMHTEAKDDSRITTPLFRWREHFQNEFQARMDWAKTSDYSSANHRPSIPSVNGITGSNALRLSGSNSQVLTLSASASDPDGDVVSYHWWQYEDAGTVEGLANIHSSTSASTEITLRSSASPGQTYHFIVEAEDSGTPPLISYRRVVVTVT